MPFELDTIRESAREGRYAVRGLRPGHGIALGNPLRRVLLSSIPGAAITRFNVQGALHEFSTLPGVKEDLIRIGLNLSAVRLRLLEPRDGTLTVLEPGAGVLRAGDLVCPPHVEVLNPEQPIATLNADARLHLTATVECGVGFRRQEEATRVRFDDIPLSADFSPVERVAYHVADTPSGECLTLDITTTGGVSPRVALALAQGILAEQLAAFGRVG